MRFRRKRDGSDEDATDQAAPEDALEEQAGGAAQVAGPRAAGPWDADEVSREEGDQNTVDLGGLVVTGRPGVELRLQVDEASQQVAAVLLTTADGALELRPFAAPRNAEIWDDVRRKIASETTRRGGTATEDEGRYGTELRVVVPVKTPDGKSATQVSRVVGVNGPRWLLRATFVGKPAADPDPDGVLESALRDVVVVRGSAPMAPGDPLPLVMPPGAQPRPGPQS